MPKKPPSRALSKQDELLEQQTDYLMHINHKNVPTKEKFLMFLWDPETKKFMGRTASSWSKIGTFYLIFYGMLAALVAICMWVFFQTLDPRIPKWKLNQSLIGTNPGLGFRPMSYENEESSLIWFKGSERKSYEYWQNITFKFLEEYYTIGKKEIGNQIKSCSYDKQPGPNEVCEVRVRDFGDCGKENKFFYHKQSPCIFLKLNRIYGWEPDCYDDPNDLPSEMPEQLKERIRNTKPERRKNVWISCEGETPADKEFLGPLEYFPGDTQGFPYYYFPYENKEGYLSPLVIVRLKRPDRGIVINVECRAWAKNIQYNRLERTGSVHFEILLD